MVEKTFVMALFLFILAAMPPDFLAAGEFTASVSSTQVDLNEGFSLNLTLKDTSPKASPDISALKKDFLIHSVQQSASTKISNGKVSSSITWGLSLTPKSEGPVNIASIVIDTSEGRLSTEPINVHVIKGATPATEDSLGLNIINKVSNPAPYKNESFTYTAVLTSKTPLYQLQVQKLQVHDAIVELVEEPKLTTKVENGVSVHAVEVSYLITPLTPGSLTIPAISIQGAIPKKTGRPQSNLFVSDFDPSVVMDGFERYKPFTLTTEEMHLDIQPPVAGLSPWLPAKGLTIEELWSDDQTLRVGEPFSRGFLIKGSGLKASQLPHLEDLQTPGSQIKIYSDKPTEQEKVIQGTVHSGRKEQFTLIPQQAGELVLPEISINWWDTTKKKKRRSIISERTVRVLPAVTVVDALISSPTTTTVPIEVPAEPSKGPFVLLYSIIASLIFLLIAALLWGFLLQRKMARLALGKPAEKKEKLPDLNPT